MRNVYYQSVGNPVQFHRLPATRPEIEFLPPALPGRTIAGLLARTLLYAATTTAVGIVAGLISSQNWFEPYDLLFILPAMLLTIAGCIYRKTLRPLLHPASLVAAALFCASPRVGWQLQCVATAAFTGLFVYAFAQHWSAICTAAPLPCLEAFLCRSRLQKMAILHAGGAAALVFFALLGDWPLATFAFGVLPPAALLVYPLVTRRWDLWGVMAESLVSWITYDPRPVPGVLQSPAGRADRRVALLLAAAALSALLMVRWQETPPSSLCMATTAYASTLGHTLHDTCTDGFEQFRYGGLFAVLYFLQILLPPMLLPPLFVLSFALPILQEAAAKRQKGTPTTEMQAILKEIHCSPDLIERGSIFLGRVVSDGSPVLVPRKAFGEHAHCLGDSGSGKTALFLCPVIEQLPLAGDCSIIAIDFKADTTELLAALLAAQEAVREDRNVEMPLKILTNQHNRGTFAFNPLKQPYWANFDLYTRTDILCGASGLNYGTDYGPGYYSSANAAILYHAMRTFPDAENFVELAENIRRVLFMPKQKELHPEIRKAGAHVHEVMKRLAACEPLNVTDNTGHSREVVDQSIDLTEVFQKPQLIYLPLSATLSPSGSPEVGRLFSYDLLAAATQVDRQIPVFLVIDEFQRMVAGNLEYILQLARSMGVGIILANQAAEDLKKSTTNLIPTVEANCRLRQWFSVSSSEDRERLIRSSGLTVDKAISRSWKIDGDGRQSLTYAESEQVVNRFTENDVALTSDHPLRSFLRISRGDGYAQYGGLPVIIESQYHISEEEYRRRKRIPWPDLPGMFQPRHQHSRSGEKETSSPRPSLPLSTEEVIERKSRPMTAAESEAIERMFGEFQDTLPSSKKRVSRRPS